MSSPAGLHLQDLILDTKATATKEQKAEAVREQVVVGTAPLAARDGFNCSKNFTSRTFGLGWSLAWQGADAGCQWLRSLAWQVAGCQWLRTKGDEAALPFRVSTC